MIKYIGESLGTVFTPALEGSSNYIDDKTNLVIECNFLGNDLYQIAIITQHTASFAPAQLDRHFVALMKVLL
ncbi:MAG: hypothetical protein ABII18_10910 [bacterium]|nr:hypothetical protein [bacterium]MBU1917391.1 hypothetical protein [bacterium]